MDPELFARVPPEVWSIIFSNLEDDPPGLYSCFNAQMGGKWRKLLEGDLTRFLFPLVIPSLGKYLKISDLLVLRGVCKTWREAVNSFLEETSGGYQEPSTTLHRNLHDPESEWFENTTGTTFRSGEEIGRFLEEMRDVREANPFPNRTVKLVDGDTSMDYGSFTSLIKIHGKNIWNLVYFADGTLNCNREMQYLFKHLPNLRCLTIKRVVDDDEEDLGLEWLTGDLPHLENLRCLNLFQDTWDLCEHLLNRYGGRLRSLQLELNALENANFNDFGAIRRQDMEELRCLKIWDIYGDSSILKRLQRFNLGHLQGLYLNYSEIGRRVSGLRSILQLINKLAGTLSELRLPFNLFNLEDIEEVDYGDPHEYRKDIAVQVPGLGWLGVPYSYLGYGIFEKILEKFPNLEHLHFMKFDLIYKDKFVEREELHQQTDHFWGKVSTLKKITVEEESTNQVIFQCTRQLYGNRKTLKRSQSPLNILFD